MKKVILAAVLLVSVILVGSSSGFDYFYDDFSGSTLNPRWTHDYSVENVNSSVGQIEMMGSYAHARPTHAEAYNHIETPIDTSGDFAVECVTQSDGNTNGANHLAVYWGPNAFVSLEWGRNHYVRTEVYDSTNGHVSEIIETPQWYKDNWSNLLLRIEFFKGKVKFYATHSDEMTEIAEFEIDRHTDFSQSVALMIIGKGGMYPGDTNPDLDNDHAVIGPANQDNFIIWHEALYERMGVCGDPGTEYLDYDFNEDCDVDEEDMAQLADEWLNCTDPANPYCDQFYKSDLIGTTIDNFDDPNIYDPNFINMGAWKKLDWVPGSLTNEEDLNGNGVPDSARYLYDNILDSESAVIGTSGFMHVYETYIGGCIHLERSGVPTNGGVRLDACTQQGIFNSNLEHWGMSVVIYYDADNFVSLARIRDGGGGLMSFVKDNGTVTKDHGYVGFEYDNAWMMQGIELTDTEIKFYASSNTTVDANSVSPFGSTDFDGMMTLDLSGMTISRPAGFTGNATLIVGEGWNSVDGDPWDSQWDLISPKTIAIDSTRIIVSPDPDPPTYCGDAGTEYLPHDFNTDCWISLPEFAGLAAEWTFCTDPADSDCDTYWWTP